MGDRGRPGFPGPKSAVSPGGGFLGSGGVRRLAESWPRNAHRVSMGVGSPQQSVVTTPAFGVEASEGSRVVD